MKNHDYRSVSKAGLIGALVLLTCTLAITGCQKDDLPGGTIVMDTQSGNGYHEDDAYSGQQPDPPTEPNLCEIYSLECNTDAFGHNCGKCSTNHTCLNNFCVDNSLVPQKPNLCTAYSLECNFDAFGNNCGSCDSDQTCLNNFCVTPPTQPDPPTEPNLCEIYALECNTDAFGHNCGTCGATQTCLNNFCVDDSLVPQKPNLCTAYSLECNFDAFGNNCGSCNLDQTCLNNFCVTPPTQPDPPEKINFCVEFGYECNHDQNGNFCGSCPGNMMCLDNFCYDGPMDTNLCIEFGYECNHDQNGNNCGSCNLDQTCLNNFCYDQSDQPDPPEEINFCVEFGYECNHDQNGNFCGSCPGNMMCLDNFCYDGPMDTNLCIEFGYECNHDQNGNNCGSCNLGQTCISNFCYTPPDICTPSCTNKQCGADDGCGNPCLTGICPVNQTCDMGVCIDNTEPIEICNNHADDDQDGLHDCDDPDCFTHPACEEQCDPDCIGKTCGDDGCNGTCGTCLDTQTCTDGTCTDDPVNLTEQLVGFQMTGKLVWDGQGVNVTDWWGATFYPNQDADPDGIVRIFMEATSVPAPPLYGGVYSEHTFKLVDNWTEVYPPSCSDGFTSIDHFIDYDANPGAPQWPKQYWILLFCP